MADPNHGGHEHTDVPVRPIAIFGAVLAAALVLVLVVTYLMMQFFLKQGGEPGAPDPRIAMQPRVTVPAPPGPQLQTDPVQDMRDHRAREEALLSSYGWVDREGGQVRIPIDRAMALLLERGAGRLRGEARR